LVLTDALIRQLAGEGQVQADSATPLGVVKTGVAVREGEPVPEVDTPEALKAALQAARGIYFPDPVKATAGIHFMKVLKTLGLDAELADRLHTFPNGAAAMAGLARAQGPGMLGCTQVTEILFAPGVALAGLLPPQFELATVYTAALATRALNPSDAAAFMALMASDEAAPLRAAGGFRA
jgi:molybdate transport system substrate-binding protein